MSQLENTANKRINSQPRVPALIAPALNKDKAARPPKVDSHLVSLAAPRSPEAEQYRALRYEIEHMRKPGECAVIGICSALPGDGKTLTAINLAGALAQDPSARTLLIEADLRRPVVTVGDQLPLGNGGSKRGLVDAILDPTLNLDEIIRYVPYFNLTILPAGKRADAPYEALNSTRFGELLTEARQRYDYVIIDTPPILPVPDCRLLAKWVDSFVMVVAADRTPREAVEEALTLLGSVKVLGLVFNGHDRSVTRYYGYGYNY
ncbi:MAG TPA: CpsD/CapB family tyrosine-protein kinase [Gammaproteobacteria bacterium]